MLDEIIDKENLKPSPLADPMVNFMFANKDVAGLAAESLIRVTLQAANQDIKIGRIISVTPQRYHSDTKTRGCRVDVEVETDENEIIVFEVETTPNYIITQRDILSAAHVFTRTSKTGDTDLQMARRMPKFIAINILNYNIRKDNKDVLQPFGIMYVKPPITSAAPNFTGYHVQLPRLMDMEADFTNEFFCWYYTMYMAHKEKKTVQEVLVMTPQLQEYAERDKGYRQFCEQYKFAAADPQTRDEYFSWYKGLMHEAGIRDAGYVDGREEGLKEGHKEGQMEERKKAEKEMFEKDRRIVMEMTNEGINDATIAKIIGFSVENISKYR